MRRLACDRGCSRDMSSIPSCCLAPIYGGCGVRSYQLSDSRDFGDTTRTSHSKLRMGCAELPRLEGASSVILLVSLHVLETTTADQTARLVYVWAHRQRIKVGDGGVFRREYPTRKNSICILTEFLGLGARGMVGCDVFHDVGEGLWANNRRSQSPKLPFPTWSSARSMLRSPGTAKREAPTVRTTLRSFSDHH